MIVSDGAYGTSLADVAGGDPAELLCLTDPGAVTSLHEAYITAGAREITTNSFLAYQLPHAQRAGVYAAAVACARRAADRALAPVRVRGVIGPVADIKVELEPLLAAGPDLVACETVTVSHVAAAFLNVVRELAPAVPATLSVSVNPSAGPDAWAWIGGLDLPAGVELGLNCCEGATPGLRPVLELLARHGVPLHVRPSAGMPGSRLAPAEWARTVLDLVDGMPVSSLGGCCGTGPAHVSALALRASPFPARS